MSNVLSISNKQKISRSAIARTKIMQAVDKVNATEFIQMRQDYHRLTEKLAEILDDYDVRLKAVEHQNLQLVSHLSELVNILHKKGIVE